MCSVSFNKLINNISNDNVKRLLTGIPNLKENVYRIFVEEVEEQKTHKRSNICLFRLKSFKIPLKRVFIRSFQGSPVSVKI